jgi:hypothetical protein
MLVMVKQQNNFGIENADTRVADIENAKMQALAAPLRMDGIENIDTSVAGMPSIILENG